MPKSNYDTGFPSGVTIRNVPILDIQNGDGNVFWVDGNKWNATDSNKGNFKYPFATLAYAISRCSENQGDKIFVAAGHTETVIAASALVFNKAGITVYFMGEGANNATISLTTSIHSDIVISAHNVTLINPRISAGIDGLVDPIVITGTNCSIVNGRYFDGGSIDTTDCIVASDTATGLIIDGWEYVPGSETGTQKESNIHLEGVDNAILRNIKITGNFATGNIENLVDEVKNIYLENIVLKNTNDTPTPGIVLDENCTGQAKNVDIRIDSGTTYVSNLAKINWDRNCIGYNTDGSGGDLIGTPSVAGLIYSGICDSDMSTSLDTIVSESFKGYGDDLFNDKYYMQIIKNAGFPGSSPETEVRQITDYVSATGTFTVTAFATNVEATDSFLVIHESLITLGRNDANNTFDSSLVVQNADGSILERLEYLQQQTIPDIYGLVFSGTCDTGMTGSITTIVSDHLKGYGDDTFNTKYYMQVIKNANSVGNAPERETRQITDYVSTTGTFTVTAFSVDIEEGDKFLVMHEILVLIGHNNADNTFDSTLVAQNQDGSLIERVEYLQQIVPDAAGLAYSGTCDTGMTGSTTTIVSDSLSGYGDDLFNTKYFMQITKNANGVGTAPETEVRQITDYVSTTGTFTVTAFTVNVEENDKFLVLHESIISLGRNDIDNTFDSTLVTQNENGSVLERLEYLQRNIIPDLAGLVYSATCPGGMAASTTVVSSTDLAGYGEDVFNDKYYMQIIKNSNSVGNAPEREVRLITDYGSATGTFVVDAFTVNVEANDKFLVIHESLVTLGRNDSNNTFDSTNVGANKNGSVLERLEYLQAQIVPDLSGLVYAGACDGGMVGSTTTIVSASMASYDDDTFNTKYYMQVIKNSNSVGNAPEREVRQITDYVGATGTFTVTAFTVNVEADDKFLVLHESIVSLGRNDANNTFDSSTVASNADGSVLERLEYAQTVVDTIDTNVGDPSGDTLTDLTAKLGDGATTVTADLGTLKTDLGDPSGHTLTSITAKIGDSTRDIKTHFSDLEDDIGDPTGDTLGSLTLKLGDGATTVTADLGTLKTNVGDPSGDTLTSVTAKLGDGATTMAADFTTLKTDVGDPSGDTLTSITAKLGDGATTVTADLGTLKTDTGTLKTDLGDPSGDTLTSVVAKLGDGATTVTADLGTLKTDLGDPSGETLTSITAKLGDGATTMAADFTTLKTNVGDPSGDTLTSTTAKLGDGATTVTADLGTLKTNLGDPSGDTLTSITAKLGDSASTVTTHFTDIKGAGWTDENLTTIDANVDTIQAVTDVLRTDVGTVFIIKKTLISSNIPQTGVDVTGNSSGGELFIEDVLVKTDSTGLAGGTNFIVYSTNNKGEPDIFEELIAQLGANKTENLCTASVAACASVLESVKKIKAKTTVADGTGAGTIDVYVKFRRLAQGAQVSPAP